MLTKDPERSTRLPAGLSGEEICSIYENLPEDTKGDKDKDLKIISSWLNAANNYKGSTPIIHLFGSQSSITASSLGRSLHRHHSQPLIFETNALLRQSDEESYSIQGRQNAAPTHELVGKPGKWGRLGPFPRNADRYPAKNMPIPEGLSDEDICANFPNHLWGDVLRGMKARGFDHNLVYECMPADTKRDDRSKDLQLLHDRFLFRTWESRERAMIGTLDVQTDASGSEPPTKRRKPGRMQPTSKLPRNPEQYPSRFRPLPAGLTDQEICSLYPNHLHGQLLVDMKARGFDHIMVYANMPQEAKRANRKLDLHLLNDRFRQAHERLANSGPPGAGLLTGARVSGPSSQQRQSDVPDSSADGLRRRNSDYQPRTTDCNTRGLEYSRYHSDVSEYTVDPPQYENDHHSTTPHHATGGLQHSQYRDPVDSNWYSDDHTQAAL